MHLLPHGIAYIHLFKNLSLEILIVMASISIPKIFTATVVEDLNNLKPPPDFNTTITNNCLNNPSLRYCNSTTPFNLLQIFKSTIVASHLCNISNNPNCVESFPKIDLRSRPNIAPLYLSFSFFWQYCPLTVLSIDLSNNSLKGSFPSDVLYCSQIQSLDLRLNTLSGEVPVEKLSSLKNLTFLNLSYNGFSECKISEAGYFERFDSSGFVRSGVLPDHRKLRTKAVVFLVGFPAFVVAAVACFGWFCFWRESCGSDERVFKASALEEASDGFSKRNLVARSGGGRGDGGLYRGVLRDGREVRIEIYTEKMTMEERRRFVEECEVLVQLRHRNIVAVRGWCNSRRFMAVVTEWVSGKDVETWLKASVPSWKQRVQVISGIAAAVRYLHQEWPGVGPYSLKSRNVMVSGKGEPVLTRFKFDDDHHSKTKRIYEFGMLVFEAVTNKRACEDFGKNESGFVEWVKQHCPERMEYLIDVRMKKTAEMMPATMQLVEFGLVCVDMRRQPSWDKFCHMLLKIAHTTHTDKGHKHAHHRQQH